MKKSYVIMVCMFNPSMESALVLVLMLITITLKGIALWRAAHAKQKNWFIVLMIPVNTVGLLELIYLFKFAKRPLTIEEIRSWIKTIKK